MIGVIIQARMSSSRLPGKVLLPLAGEPVLFHVVERVKRAKRLDMVIVATSTEKEDDVIEQFCTDRKYRCFRGSRDDVLARYVGAAEAFGLDTIVRITSDCPLIDPVIIDQTIALREKSGADYVSNALPGERTFPRGLDCEVFLHTALTRAASEARESYEHEHVTPYIHENKQGKFRIGQQLQAEGIYGRPQYRLTLDYAEDYELFKRLYEMFYKPGDIIDVPTALTYLDQHPEVVAINAMRDAEYPSHGIRI